MLKQNPTLLYVGSALRAAALKSALEPLGWLVYTPGTVLEALAMYAFTYPDVIVLEENSEQDFTGEVYAHLRSVDAENLMVVTDTPELYDVPGTSTTQLMPGWIDSAALVETLLKTVQQDSAGLIPA